ncbi:hypothetical protein Ddc_00580 [Ditylenchus destructor]|nr:hypothetical protein Ddc_00580 [Ditylenchus destructor]
MPAGILLFICTTICGGASRPKPEVEGEFGGGVYRKPLKRGEKEPHGLISGFGTQNMWAGNGSSKKG